MKLVNYQLQNQIELLNEQKSNSYFKEYLQSVLEDESKPYYQKADYVGLSLNELKNKIDFLSNDIKELQAYKKKLSSALDIAKTLTAEVFIKNGVDRIDGNIISSITLSKPSTKTKDTLTIIDENEVMKMGYVKFEPDTEAILKAMATDMGKKELEKFVSITSETIDTPAKVKINTKRSANNSSISTDELLQLKQVA
jgi:hypothetical protein